jgi:hypothetical protein
MAFGAIRIQGCQFLLKGVRKQLVAMLPQEHKQLGPADALDDGVFCRRQLDWWMPHGWAHGMLSSLSVKKTMLHHATTQ